ncbi:STAS domain-containing protein [Paractinoplanes brasiliensis]|uniref:STAS domain-containing protein n=1 Tax=Paractinoplanes brasiliensis TaxID=52695 RepID=A0A4R6JPY0_9ACTN|nr:STAS domain-containing protein [Actinoplanes brasiliensis]TDO38510.1 hypothetical protein C8E87_2167 [Actinoplanes brasiliensis]GID26716.1 hypothetical protein Abr02nite_16990 [Actinoplanes brasiliensis]
MRVDQADLRFLDSSALGVLFGGAQPRQRTEPAFFVVDSSPTAQHVIVTGLSESSRNPKADVSYLLGE